MTNTEKIKEIFEEYYKRDEDSQEIGEMFKAEAGAGEQSALFKKLYQISGWLDMQFPEQYYSFFEAASGGSIEGKGEGTVYFFYEKQILEWNDEESVLRSPTLQNFADYFVFAQTMGDDIYFFDVKNKLGKGIDAIWKADVCCTNKERYILVAKDLIDFLEHLARNEELEKSRPLRKVPEFKSTEEDGLLALKLIEERAKADEKVYKEILEAKAKIDKYFGEFKKKYEANEEYELKFYDKRYIEFGVLIKEKLKKQYLDDVSIKFLYILIYLNGYKLVNKYGEFFLKLPVSYNGENEYDKWFRINVINGFFRFQHCFNDIFKKIDNNEFSEYGYFILDIYNKFGRGNEAIYMISNKARSIEEAYFAANDIVDFIRKICEEEEFELIPAGKVK